MRLRSVRIVALLLLALCACGPLCASGDAPYASWDFESGAPWSLANYGLESDVSYAADECRVTASGDGHYLDVDACYALKFPCASEIATNGVEIAFRARFPYAGDYPKLESAGGMGRTVKVINIDLLVDDKISFSLCDLMNVDGNEYTAFAVVGNDTHELSGVEAVRNRWYDVRLLLYDGRCQIFVNGVLLTSGWRTTFDFAPGADAKSIGWFGVRGTGDIDEITVTRIARPVTFDCMTIERGSGNATYLVSNEPDMPGRIRFLLSPKGAAGLKASTEHEGGFGFVEKANPGTVLDDEIFSRGTYLAETTNDTLTVAFCWWHPSRYMNPTHARYGWFTVARGANGIEVLGSGMADGPGIVSVPGRGTLEGGPYQEAADGIVWRYSVKDATAIVAKAFSPSSTSMPEGLKGVLRIPTRLGDCPVVEIKNDAFRDLRGVEEVDVPPTIARMGANPFYIRDRPRFVIHDLSAWCRASFDRRGYASGIYLNGEPIKDLVIPADVETLGEGTFSQFGNIETVDFGPTCRTIGTNAFLMCTGIRKLVIPSTIKTIGSRSFASCFGLEDLRVEGPDTEIGPMAFGYGFALTTVVANVAPERIDPSAFYDCTVLSTGGYVSDIAACFHNCGSNATLRISDRAKRIGFAAFESQTLQSLIIPASVTNVAAGAFVYLQSLDYLVLEGDAPDGLVDEYLSLEGGGSFTYPAVRPTVVVPEGAVGYERIEVLHPNDIAANGRTVRACIVAGISAKDADADFTASITMENGTPKVSYSPDLGGNRVYTVYGSTDLKSWSPVGDRPGDFRYFKVSVEMPE